MRQLCNNGVACTAGAHRSTHRTRTVYELPREYPGVIFVRHAGDGVNPGEEVRDESSEPSATEAGAEEVLSAVETPPFPAVPSPFDIRDGTTCFLLFGQRKRGRERESVCVCVCIYVGGEGDIRGSYTRGSVRW